MKSNYIQSTIKAKELLKDLLKKHLDNNLSNLEINNQREISALSSIKNTSDELLNYLSLFPENNNEDKKLIIIPKLKIDINNNTNKSNIKTNKEEIFIGIESILKNKNHNNKRNKELSTILLDKNNTTNKAKVSFIENSIKSTNINVTPDNIKKHKPFINNYTSKKKEKKYIKRTLTENISEKDVNLHKKKKMSKNAKCLTERNEKNINSNTTPFPFVSKEKNKKMHNNNISLNSNNLENKSIKSRINKKGFKTSLNYYPNKNKSLFNNSVKEFQLNESLDINEDKIKEDEKNLKKICDSLLIDVNKDELLVNHSQITINDNFGKEILLRKISFSNKEDNKKNDKNILYDSFKQSIPYILKYLNLQNKLNLYQTNKKILKLIINIQIKSVQKTIDDINSILISKKIIMNNINEISLVKDIKPFELNNNSKKAISLLNSLSKTNFIKEITNYKNQSNLNKNTDKIILIFDLYFIALGKKKILNSLNNNNKKIEFISNYFKNNKNKSIGTIIENDLKEKKFDNFIIDTLYEYSYKYINIINPNYYKKINKDIAILVFLIKNILDFVGISFIDNKNPNNSKNNEQKIIFINKCRLYTKTILLQKYNQILSSFK